MTLSSKNCRFIEHRFIEYRFIEPPLHRTTLFKDLGSRCRLALGNHPHLFPWAQPLNLRIQRHVALVSVKTLDGKSLVPTTAQH